ncbi:MAG: peroxidase family protein [Hyphomicrobium sp.]
MDVRLNRDDLDKLLNLVEGHQAAGARMEFDPAALLPPDLAGEPDYRFPYSSTEPTDTVLVHFGQYFDHGIEAAGKGATTEDILGHHQSYGAQSSITDLLRLWSIDADGHAVKSAYLLSGELDSSGRALLPTLDHVRANYRIMTGGDELPAADAVSLVSSGFGPRSDGLATGSENAPDFGSIGHLLVAGEGRANGHAALTSIYTIWHRNHNFWVDKLKAETRGSWSEDEYFSAARIINTAEYQRVVFTEFADALTRPLQSEWGESDDSSGDGYTGYDEKSSYSLPRELVAFVDEATGHVRKVTMAEAIDSQRHYSSQLSSSSLDIQSTHDKSALSPGFIDLSAVIAHPGRDSGSTSFNQLRTDLFALTGLASLRPYTDWNDFQHRNHLTDDVITKLDAAYPDGIEAMDLWVGGLAEAPADGQLGSTLGWLVRDHVERAQDSTLEVAALHGIPLGLSLPAQTFSEMIARHTGVTDLPEDIFDFDATDFADAVFLGDGDDVYVGSAGDDVIFGEGGDDTISGGDGSDLIDGGEGQDRLSGDGGEDVIIGGDGSDIIFGGADDDTLSGDDGDDVLVGDKDTIEEIETGEDAVPGLTAATDAIIAADDSTPAATDASTNSAPNSASADTPRPSSSDAVAPVAAAPAPDSNSASSSVVPAEGEALLASIPAAADGSDESLTSNTTSGTATVALVASIETRPVETAAMPSVEIAWDVSAATVTSSLQQPVVSVASTPATDPARDDAIAAPRSFDMSLLEQLNLLVEAAIAPTVAIDNDILDGGEGNDQLYGGGGEDVLIGGTGNDLLSGGSGNDVLIAGAGNDLLAGGSGSDLLDGGSGADLIYGGGGSDIVAGGEGADTAIGGSGNDILIGGAEADSLSGDSGDDIIIGGSGNDQIAGGDGNDCLYGDDQDDERDAEREGETVVGSSGSDLITGTSGVDTLSSQSGTDLVRGGSGDDYISGGSGNDELYGDEGSDVLAGGSGADHLDGGEGSDYLDGDSGDDVLVGGAGNDILAGGYGANRYEGGTGDDRVVAISGSDTIILKPGFGNDTVVGFDSSSSASGSQNLIDVSAYGFQADSIGNDIVILSIGNDTLISIGNDSLTLLSVNAQSIDRNDFIFS